MAILITPTSKLEAVNEILRNAGVDTVNTLDDDVLDVENALAALELTSIELQKEGWWFNKEYLWPLTPDASNRLTVPANTLSADVDGNDKYTKDFILRGATFYDRKNRTYDITAATTVTLVRALQFEELPTSARLYIIYRAARKFQSAEVGDPYNEQSDTQDELRAMEALRREEINAIDANALRDNRTNLKSTLRTRVITR